MWGFLCNRYENSKVVQNERKTNGIANGISEIEVKQYVLERFDDVRKSGRTRNLVEFQAKNKYMVMAHSQEVLKTLGNIVANHKKIPLRDILDKYGKNLQTALEKKPTVKKHANVILDETQPSHTLTTLPDDLLHYSEPRILTVREFARLQSFPDWFSFSGKYTTGGKQRKDECPRYTQVGNAVPPLLSRYIGDLIRDLLKKYL